MVSRSGDNSSGRAMWNPIMKRFVLNSTQLILGSYVAVVALMSLVARWQIPG